VVDAPPSPVDIEDGETISKEELRWSLDQEPRKDSECRDSSLTKVRVKKEAKATAPAENGAGSETSHGDDLRLSVESAEQNHESPFSSPSGDDTDQYDDRQDSPITSIDEDAKTRHSVIRKSSGKVLELVVKFDGLAKAASEEPPIIKPDRSKSPFRASDDDNSDDTAEFGDFEDGDTNEQLEAPDTTERPKTPEKPAAFEQPTTPEPERQSTRSGASTTVSSPQSTRGFTKGQKKASSGAHVNFNVDLGIVGKLFEKLEQTSNDPMDGLDREISDHILSDSFTEISERKTWYRISRMGSSRKHNAGDDENYRLVTWPTSAIRVDTIKIVRRWMEEDSIAGRVTLGGGVSKTQKNMFGWDSSAEPVTLDTVFGRKKHIRGSSVQSLHDPQRKVSGTSYRPSSVVVPPVATFGWSSNSPTSVPQTQLPSVIQPPSDRITIPMKPILPPPQKPAVIEKPAPPVLSAPGDTLPQSAAQDDDDDWGEMVSSPSESKATGGGLLSLDEAFSFPAPSSVTALKPSEASAFTPVDTLAPSSLADPWAVADFSVFESPPKGPPKQTAASNSTIPVPPPPSVSASFAISSPAFELPLASSGAASGLVPPARAAPKQGSTDSTFSPTTPLEIASPIALPSVDEEPEVDDQVRRIIANLPDLSYMLH